MEEEIGYSCLERKGKGLKRLEKKRKRKNYEKGEKEEGKKEGRICEKEMNKEGK